jgi:hypothetical protein
MDSVGRHRRVLSNNSGNNGGYGDYTGQTVNVSAGNAYNITLTPGFAGTAYAEQWRIWIDFNRDGDFTDAGEQVFDSNFPQVNPVNGSINIPGSASGTTRMRIAMKWNAAPTSCESFQYGEVEDYTIAIGSSAQLSAISGQAEDVKRPGLSNLDRPNAINNHSSPHARRRGPLPQPGSQPAQSDASTGCGSHENRGTERSCREGVRCF